LSIEQEALKAVDESFNELVDMFQSILRIDTSNPPGNEVKLDEYIHTILSKEGLDCEVIESEPGRGNVIAYMDGESGKKLMYLSHLDVVPVQNPSKWKHPPFSATIDGNWIYGRGAVDCKSLVAAQLFSLIVLKRTGIKPKLKLIFASTADEEMGGRAGLGWLVENAPEKVRADYVVNEGGGLPIRLRNRGLLYLVDVAEKGVCWVKLRFKGRSGHASMPYVKDNAMYMTGSAIKALLEYKLKAHYTNATKKLIKDLLTFQYGFMGKVIFRILTSPLEDLFMTLIERKQSEYASFLKSITRLTISPTIVRGGVKENVIPSECELTLDCRLLPGQDRNYVLNCISDALKDIESYEIEVVKYSEASQSPLVDEFLMSIERVMNSLLPDFNVRVAPYIMPASSDSRHARKLGAVVYGFAPLSPTSDCREIVKLAHGDNERIDLSSLKLMAKFFTLLPLKWVFK